MRRLIAALIVLAAASCAGPSGGSAPPIPLPAEGGPSLEEKAALFERGLDAFHLLPWGALAYHVRLPEGPDGPVRYEYASDTVAWTGALLGAEAERWAAKHDPAALDRVRTVLGGLATLSAVTGERGLWARFACPKGFIAGEPHPERWHRGGSGYADWRWRGDVSKDQMAGLVYGLGAVVDLVEEPGSRARAARLLGDLADRVLGRDAAMEEARGVPTTYGDISPRVVGLPVGVNAAIAVGLADAAARGTGERRHRRFLEELVAAGASESLRFPTVRLLGKENWNNANMTAMALASILRSPPPEEDACRLRIRRDAESSLRRILDLHRGEGNAFWIAVAAPAGEAAGATARDLADARAQLLRFPTDLRVRRIDHSGLKDLSRSFWNSKGGRTQFLLPLPVDAMGANAFAWKSNPYEVVPEPADDPRTIYSGVDFLAAFWPLRRLGAAR